MAIHYYNEHQAIYNKTNFGDDINPSLLGSLFDRSIIESPDVCILGIGTILDDRTFASVQSFKKKVIFSSGAGYGKLSSRLDDSWDVACVRGPKTAALLDVPPQKAICDGAALLADIHSSVPIHQRRRPLFIPHIGTHLISGRELQSVSADLKIDYIAPDAPFNIFIDAVRHASFVVAEAMHGAILADAMRTPWIAVHMISHNDFKWKDMCASLNLDYRSHVLHPRLWDGKGEDDGFVKKAGRWIKRGSVLRSMKRILAQKEPLLSDDDLFNRKLIALRSCVATINETYRT